MNQSTDSIVVAALYRFVPLHDYVDLRPAIQEKMDSLGVFGTLLLAPEGINGTIASSRDAMNSMLEYLRNDPRLEGVDVKESYCDRIPFKRCRVRLKREIVTMGVEGIDPHNSVGTYIDPEAWNELIADPEVTLIDTRNDYEVAIGTFEGAISPETHSFREFPKFVDENLDPARHKKIAMFCTGGIRCEKSTALLKQRGFDQVFHLRGGILKYLERIPESESRWHGDCFVFDKRVSVGHGLRVGQHVMCFGCGWPVTAQQQQHKDFKRGVHCPHCVSELTEDQKVRFAERQRQIDIERLKSVQHRKNDEDDL